MEVNKMTTVLIILAILWLPISVIFELVDKYR